MASELTTADDLDALPSYSIIGVRGSEIERIALQKTGDGVWLVVGNSFELSASDLEQAKHKPLPALLLWSPDGT